MLHFITVNEQSESYQDNSFHSSIASFIFGRSYHQHLFISTVEYFKCLYSGRKKSPRNTSLVQLFVLSGISGSYNVTRCTRKLNNALVGSTVMCIIKLNLFPVPVRLHTGSCKLNFYRYFTMFCDI